MYASKQGRVGLIVELGDAMIQKRNGSGIAF